MCQKVYVEDTSPGVKFGACQPSVHLKCRKVPLSVLIVSRSVHVAFGQVKGRTCITDPTIGHCLNPTRGAPPVPDPPGRVPGHGGAPAEGAATAGVGAPDSVPVEDPHAGRGTAQQGAPRAAGARLRAQGPA